MSPFPRSIVAACLACACALGVGEGPPEFPPPATLPDDREVSTGLADEACTDEDDTCSGDTTGFDPGTTTGEAPVDDAATDSESGGESSTGAVDPSPAPPASGEGGTTGSGAAPVSCLPDPPIGSCAECADIACCAALQASSSDAEASCVSSCMLDGAMVTECGDPCGAADPLGEPGITDLFVCLANDCAGSCG